MPSRYAFLALAVILAVSAILMSPFWPHAILPAVIFSGLSLIGLVDLGQSEHAIRRNYPLIGRVRWLAELVRPEIRQYLIESDEEEAPFSRNQRSLVYQRAKNIPAERAFGAEIDAYRSGYAFLSHSAAPHPAAPISTFRVLVGSDQCAAPYSTSLLNISAMSFGSLSANAIRALNRGARMGDFYHDTGEGAISPYHREGGGDIVWEVASGYFGCRTAEGRFDPARFADHAGEAQVKMIEIKLSQGAKPGHGGVLPAAKVTPEIAATRGVPLGQDCISPARHSAFSTPLELMDFIAELRRLSGGKPVGFKLCIGQPEQFMGMVKAMLRTGVRPDFIVIDGSEGGTGAAPAEFADHVGWPMREGLIFANNVLVGAGLRAQIRLAAAGKVVSAFDMANLLALGADWTNAARGFMFALGCVQSLACNTNACPTGVATQDPLRQKALVVSNKAERVFHFHHNTLKALSELVAAAGLDHPSQLTAQHLMRRTQDGALRTFADLHWRARPGELIHGEASDAFYREAWRIASADGF